MKRVWRDPCRNQAAAHRLNWPEEKIGEVREGTEAARERGEDNKNEKIRF